MDTYGTCVCETREPCNIKHLEPMQNCHVSHRLNSNHIMDQYYGIFSSSQSPTKVALYDAVGTQESNK